MHAVTFPNTTSKLLAAGGSSWTMPTTRDGIDKRLESIAAGKGGHKPTDAHPFRACFEGKRHNHYDCDVAHHGPWYRRPAHSASYGERLTCEEYIRAVQLSQREGRVTA